MKSLDELEKLAYTSEVLVAYSFDELDNKYRVGAVGSKQIRSLLSIVKIAKKIWELKSSYDGSSQWADEMSSAEFELYSELKTLEPEEKK